MKKFLSTVCFMLALITTSSAQQQELTAHFFSNEPIVLNNEGYGTASFGLSATQQQMDKLVEVLAASPKKFSFSYEARKDESYDYSCELTLLQDQGIRYLHKTLLSLNVLFFDYSGTTYPINKMLEILK